MTILLISMALVSILGASMAFKSKKQWKWAFANKKRFARRWAHESKPYKSLPSRKAKKKK